MIDEDSLKEQLHPLKKIMLKLGFSSSCLRTQFLNMFSMFKKPLLGEKSRIVEICSEDYLKNVASMVKVLLSSHDKILIVNFNFFTRELNRELQLRHTDPEKNIYFIDTVSYFAGKGCPPTLNTICLNRPTNFENIFYYSIMQLNKMNAQNPFIIFLDPSNLLEYSDYDESGVFFRWYTRQMQSNGLATLFLIKQDADDVFKNVVKNVLPKFN